VEERIKSPAGPFVVLETNFVDFFGVFVAAKYKDPHKDNHKDNEPHSVALPHMRLKLTKNMSTGPPTKEDQHTTLDVVQSGVNEEMIDDVAIFEGM
jgi:hypothetical protein